MMLLTDFDKQLLNLLQCNLPVCTRPFAHLGEMLGVSEETVLARLKELKEEGYLRRIGTFFNSDRLGYHGTLIALCVDAEQLSTVANAVNQYVGVTHNYERRGEFNLWFTLQVASDADREAVLTQVASLPGVRRCLNLPSEKKYKIRVQFELH